MRVARRLLALAALLAAVSAVSPAQSRPRVDERLLSAFTYRNLGPFRMGARVSEVAVPARPDRDHRYTFYVAFWTGGLWKTTNNGTTFEPVFDGQGKFAIGAVALAPSNPEVVWVGTGDAFTSRSSYAGDGVYRSTRTTSPASSSTPPTPTSRTSRRWGTSTPTTPSGGCSARPTAGGRGRRCCT
jgi:hypothetical protein